MARAAATGGQITSAALAQAVAEADVTPSQAKKLLRSLSEAGVTVVVDGSASTRRPAKVAAARSATAAAKAAKATVPNTADEETAVKSVKSAAKATPARKATPKQSDAEAIDKVEAPARKTTAKKAAPAAE